MKQNSFTVDWTIRLVFCLMYANSLALAVSGGLALSFGSLTIMLTCSAAAFVFYLMFGFKKVSKYVLWAVLALIGIGLIVFAIMCLTGAIDFFGITDYVFQLMGGSRKINHQVDTAVFMIVTVGIGLLSAFLLSRRVLFLLSAGIALTIFLVQLLFGKIFDHSAYAVLTYTVIIMGIYGVFTRFEAASGGQDFGYKRLGVLATCLVCTVGVIVLTVAFPFANEHSQTFDVQDLDPNAFTKRGSGYFQLASTGVGTTDAQLGDTLRLNFSDNYSITSKKPVYIAATYNNYYDGKGWQSSDMTHADDGIKAIPSNITRYMVDDTDAKLITADGKKISNAYKDNEIVELDSLTKMTFLQSAGIKYSVDEITIKIAKNKHYFRSVYRTSDMVNMTKPDRRLLWADGEYNLYTNLYMRNGLSYSFTTLNYELSDLYDYLRSDKYNDGRAVSSKISKTAVSNYTERVYKDFLQLPDVPQRVKDLASRIVADSEATSRIDQVWALMEYLWRYRYRTSYVELEDGSVTDTNGDFVDAFLFGNSETDEPSEEYYGGYCTGFASSLAVMCRAVGIPSRYVEGFSPLDKAGEELMVDNSYSHAWVEVYFDGVGWVMFEPTTHDADKLYGINTDDYKPKPEEPEPDDPEDDPEDDPQDDPSQDPEQDQPVADTPQTAPTVPNSGVNNDSTTIGERPLFENEDGFKITLKDVLYVLCVLAAIAIIIMIPVAIVNHRKRQIARMYTLETRAFTLVIWRELGRVLKFVKLAREKDETVHDYLKRISEKCADNAIYDAYISFDKALYSQEQLSDNDRAYVAAAYKLCDAYAQRHSKRFWFNLNRYLLHRM